MQGYLLINKPQDWTSHDVVAKLRGITKIKKIGHAGTLDPFATGLLIVGVGRPATKHLDRFHEFSKTYEATIALGHTSTTYDTEGEISTQDTDTIPTKQEVENTVKQCIGPQQQLAPMYSAKKVDGQKLYDLARKGIEIERKTHDIVIHDIELIQYIYPNVYIKVTCSTGTYIRTLAHDIGQSLGVGGYCTELKRTSIGPYTIKDAQDMETLTKQGAEPFLRNLIDKSIK